MNPLIKSAWLRSLLAILALYEMDAFAQDSLIRIDLRQKAVVSGARVYLSDIAKCSATEQRCQESRGIDIASSPLAGRISYVSRSSVEAILEKEWPGVRFEISGAESVRVEAVAVDIAPDDLMRRLQDEIAGRTQAVAPELRVNVIRVQSMGFAHIRPTQMKIEFPDLSAISFDQVDWVSKNLPGSRTLQVRISNPKDPDDKSLLQATVSFNVERLLPVLKQTVVAGSVIESSQIVMAWIPMRRGFQDFATDPNLISGKKARQSIASGEVIPVRYLDSPLAVIRNQQVTMIVRRGDLEIASRATTVDQGSVGQTVEVVNAATKKRMRARVIDDKTVEAVAF
jgi:flagella basal body P-ring formation protein FlgA